MTPTTTQHTVGSFGSFASGVDRSRTMLLSADFIVWVLLGLLNNMPYVIMLASAKYISEGGTSIVYLTNTLPGLLVKLSAPYWFDTVSYQSRLRSAAMIMGVAFFGTGYFSQEGIAVDQRERMMGQLMGVACVSVQIGLGEASLLALAGKQDTSNKEQSHCLLAFSAGTGLAGPFGYLWKIALSEYVGLSVATTLFLGAFLAVLYGTLCWVATLNVHEGYETIARGCAEDQAGGCAEGHEVELQDRMEPSTNSLSQTCEETQASESIHSERLVTPISHLSGTQRFQLVLSLWPYIIPLFTVYAAEYACQAGAWTAIGFPVDSVTSRTKFYEQSNWLYQVGTFLSRSSGAFVTVSLSVLWLMPVLQTMNLCLFLTVAVRHGVLYQRGILLSGSFYTGLLGGAVYIHGYKRIVADMPPEYIEFALSSTCVAEALGVLFADVLGLFLQSCLYESNGLSGALATCPL